MVLKRIFLLTTFLFLLTTSCKEEKESTPETDLPQLNVAKDTTVIGEKQGCETPTDACLDIRVEYPKFNTIGEEGKQRIEEYIQYFLSDFLVTDRAIDSENLNDFVKDKIEVIKRNQRESVGSQIVKLNTEFSTLFENENLVSLQNIYRFEDDGQKLAGEGHVIFDLQTNEILTLPNIIADEQQVKQLILKKIKLQNQVEDEVDIEELGFLFSDDDFAITDNIGITGDQIFFTYLPEEVAPKSGGILRFAFQKEEISGLLTDAFVKKWESTQ